MESDEAIEDSLDFCQEGGAVPVFKLLETFRYLCERGYVEPWYTTFRPLETGEIDRVYYLGEDGMLYRIGPELAAPEDPAAVLSPAKASNGWEVEKLRRWTDR